MNEYVTENILRAIADAEGTNPDALDIILYNWVDVDAIRMLVNHGRNSLEVQFSVPNHTVTITGNGTVRVDGAQRRILSAN